MNSVPELHDAILIPFINEALEETLSNSSTIKFLFRDIKLINLSKN